MSDLLSATRVIYHGRVQGVGFRFTVHLIAKQFGVSGFVRNRSDGTVELVAQGETSEVRSYLAAVAERFDGNVTSMNEVPLPIDARMSGFEIRR